MGITDEETMLRRTTLEQNKSPADLVGETYHQNNVNDNDSASAVNPTSVQTRECRNSKLSMFPATREVNLAQGEPDGLKDPPVTENASVVKWNRLKPQSEKKTSKKRTSKKGNNQCT